MRKIDRSFIATMTQSEQSAAIVRSVVDLAKAFRLDLVAEGVETVEQEVKLCELGCDLAQGLPCSASRFRRPKSSMSCSAARATR